MAGDWIAMRHDLAEDPAVMDMAEHLGCDELEIVGRLYGVWRWFDEQTTDGHAASVTGARLDARIDRLAKRAGFAAAMRAVDWLGDEGIPRFDTWMSKSAKSRLLAARRKQKERGSDVTPESRNERDENVTREEESREEEPLSSLGEERVARASKRAKRWRTVPREEQLTAERLAFATGEGLSAEQANREWRKFVNYEFRTPKTDVDRTWGNWVLRAAESPPAGRGSGATPFPTPGEKRDQERRDFLAGGHP